MVGSRRYHSRAREDRLGQRRRRRRGNASAVEEGDPAGGWNLLDDGRREGDPGALLRADDADAGSASGGAWDVILRFFRRHRKPTLAERGDPPPGEDPVRRILAVPRGAARLDSFEETLTELMPGTHGHRGVALAFHRELTAMAEQAGVDLALLKRRVEACANALVEADEAERAGELLARIGKKHRAAELFVSAGAIDKLEEAHFEIEHAEGGRRLDARLQFERFEARFLVGMRGEALEALVEAVKLWPENPVYREVLEGAQARVPASGRLELRAQDGAVIRLERRWPLVIGRGDDVGLPLKSPLVSRAHAEISLVSGRPFLRALSDRGAVLAGDAPAHEPVELHGELVLSVGGVELTCRVGEDVVELASTHEPHKRTLALRGARAEVGDLRVRFDDAGRAFLERHEGVALNGGRILQDALLLLDDRVTLGGATWVVVGPR